MTAEFNFKPLYHEMGSIYRVEGNVRNDIAQAVSTNTHWNIWVEFSRDNGIVEMMHELTAFLVHEVNLD